ncbi:MAG: hypothetical protein ACFHX7_08075 [Pseudomonadota bacterium]
MTAALDVWVGDKRVGELLREEYEYSFQYLDPTSLDPTRELLRRKCCGALPTIG